MGLPGPCPIWPFRAVWPVVGHLGQERRYVRIGGTGHGATPWGAASVDGRSSKRAFDGRIPVPSHGHRSAGNAATGRTEPVPSTPLCSSPRPPVGPVQHRNSKVRSFTATGLRGVGAEWESNDSGLTVRLAAGATHGRLWGPPVAYAIDGRTDRYRAARCHLGAHGRIVGA